MTTHTASVVGEAHPTFERSKNMKAKKFLTLIVAGAVLGWSSILTAIPLPLCIDPPPDMVAWYLGDDGPNDFLRNHHGIPVGITEAWVPKVGSGTLALPYLFPRM